MYRGIAISLIMLLVTTVTVLAAPAPKLVDTIIIPSTAQALDVGDTLDLEAITLKHGSHYSVLWQGADYSNTILNPETGEYLSTATFSAAEPGEYTIIYTITMTAGKGKSPVVFIGTAQVDVTVLAPEPGPTLLGIELRGDWSEAFTNPSGQNFRTYTGAVWAIWSDGEEIVRLIYETIRSNHPRGGFDLEGVVLADDGQEHPYSFFVSLP